MTDQELFQQWQQDRGTKAAPLSRENHAQITRALRARYEEQLDPKPLKHCAQCKVMTRGDHHSR